MFSGLLVAAVVRRFSAAQDIPEHARAGRE